MRNILLLSAFLWPFFVFSAWAVEYPLPDPDQEARAEAVFHQLRCKACASDSLADSPADVAVDIRRDIRTRVAAGDNFDGIRNFLATRYGDSVTLRPTPASMATVLWVGPTVLLVVVILVIWFSIRIEAARNSREK